jgi:hypothetical protein
MLNPPDHHPLPWSVDADSGVLINDAAGNVVAIPARSDRELAAFIVAAVNATAHVVPEHDGAAQRAFAD